MTEIRLWKYDGIHCMKIKGHSGYSVAGKDIVCAGISTLAYTFLNELTNREKDGVFVSFNLKPGYFEIQYNGNEKIISTLESLILTGFRMLETNFPENLTLVGEK